MPRITHGAPVRSLSECRCQWQCRIGVLVSESDGHGFALRIGIARPGTSLGLTASETEVAAFAAGGHSNSAIARHRFCAERTVTNQLNSVYSKLGISGRRELRAALARGATSGPDQTFTSSQCLGEVADEVSSGRLSLLGQSWLDTEHQLVGRLNPPNIAARLKLSPREREILVRSASGHSNKVTAYELGISSSAVSTYLTRARRKLGLERAELLFAPLVAAAATL